MANKAIVQVCETKIDLGLYLRILYRALLIDLIGRNQMNYRLWSYIVGAGIVVVVFVAIQGDVLAFWLLAAILIAEGLVAYVTSKKLPEEEREDARTYGLSAGSVGMIVLMIMLATKHLW